MLIALHSVDASTKNIQNSVKIVLKIKELSLEVSAILGNKFPDDAQAQTQDHRLVEWMVYH